MSVYFYIKSYLEPNRVDLFVEFYFFSEQRFFLWVKSSPTSDGAKINDEKRMGTVHTVDGRNPAPGGMFFSNLVNNGINYQPQLVRFRRISSINSIIPPTQQVFDTSSSDSKIIIFFWV